MIWLWNVILTLLLWAHSLCHLVFKIIVGLKWTLKIKFRFFIKFAESQSLGIFLRVSLQVLWGPLVSILEAACTFSLFPVTTLLSWRNQEITLLSFLPSLTKPASPTSTWISNPFIFSCLCGCWHRIPLVVVSDPLAYFRALSSLFLFCHGTHPKTQFLFYPSPACDSSGCPSLLCMECAPDSLCQHKRSLWPGFWSFSCTSLCSSLGGLVAVPCVSYSYMSFYILLCCDLLGIPFPVITYFCNKSIRTHSKHVCSKPLPNRDSCFFLGVLCT